MKTFADYEKCDGLGLAELIKQGEVSAKEVCEAAIERIEEKNPGLNAVITPMFEIGRQTAASAQQGPFAGVPFLLKDLLGDYKGVRLASGSRAYRDYISDHDGELVKRWKASGVTILGKTSTPEFGLVGVTEPELFGPTRNPWDLERTPGGSSGGSAAAVASGMVPLASGGDGGGSIRIPSSFCGLFGLKPTRLRNPTGPDRGRIWQGAAVEHVLTRSVRDSAAMLDATHGYEAGAPFAVPPPERPFLDECGREPGQLRIAFNPASPLGTEVHPECRQAALDAAKLLEGLGHHVEEAAPEIDGIALALSYFTLYFGEVSADIEQAAKDTGRKVGRADFEPTTWLFGRMGRVYTSKEFVQAIRLWDAAARTMGRFHEKYDLYLTPTVAQPPARIGELLPKPYERALMRVITGLGLEGLAKKAGVVNTLALDILARTPFTQLANFTGQPAMSIPLGRHADGLPIGVHFIAPFAEEARLIRLASQLEKAAPWKGRAE